MREPVGNDEPCRNLHEGRSAVSRNPAVTFNSKLQCKGLGQMKSIRAVLLSEAVLVERWEMSFQKRHSNHSFNYSTLVSWLASKFEAPWFPLTKIPQQRQKKTCRLATRPFVTSMPPFRSCLPQWHLDEHKMCNGTIDYSRHQPKHTIRLPHVTEVCPAHRAL